MKLKTILIFILAVTLRLKSMDRMVQEAHETGKVHTMFGRQRELPDINSRNFNRRSLC